MSEVIRGMRERGLAFFSCTHFLSGNCLMTKVPNISPECDLVNPRKFPGWCVQHSSGFYCSTHFKISHIHNVSLDALPYQVIATSMLECMSPTPTPSTSTRVDGGLATVKASMDAAIGARAMLAATWR